MKKRNIRNWYKKKNKILNDLMTLKVYQFPFIGLVWMGVIIMVAGLLMSMWQRIKANKKLSAAS